MIRILTFNVWGLPGFLFRELAPFRKRRIRMICEELSKQKWDYVLIQEAWTSRDRALFKNCGYDYALDLDDKNQRLDSGLLILSRHPVLENTAKRIRYATNGAFVNCLTDGEFFANKSAIMAQFNHPGIGPVWVANTHLVSSGGRRDRYQNQRLQQIDELTRELQPKSNARPVIIGGDFNCEPGSTEWHRLSTALQGFTVHDAVEIPHTFHPEQGDEVAAKVDHIFMSNHFERIDTKLQFVHWMHHKGHPFRASDHLGLELSLRFDLDSLVPAK